MQYIPYHPLLIFIIIPTVAIITPTIKAPPSNIHIGDNTHSHDHSMCPVSFNPIKSNVNHPAKPIPQELLLLSFILTPPIYCPASGRPVWHTQLRLPYRTGPGLRRPQANCALESQLYLHVCRRGSHFCSPLSCNLNNHRSNHCPRILKATFR